MKTVAKFFLWLTSLIVPVFIAACYGAPFSYYKSGKVIDSETKDGIKDIEVTCIYDGSAHSVTRTAEDGTYTLAYDMDCDSVYFFDDDGEANGGQYLPRTIQCDTACEDITVELHR